MDMGQNILCHRLHTSTSVVLTLRAPCSTLKSSWSAEEGFRSEILSQKYRVHVARQLRQPAGDFRVSILVVYSPSQYFLDFGEKNGSKCRLSLTVGL